METRNKIVKDKYTYELIDKNNIQNLYHIEVPEPVKINDQRSLSDFKIQTFGGYKKNDVMTNLTKSIETENLDHSIYLSFQLLFSGNTIQLLDKLYLISAKLINTSNPTLSTFLSVRYKHIYSIMSNPIYSKKNVLFIRNNCEIRKLLAELVTILTLSRKRKLETLPKISNGHYDLDVLTSKLEAKNTTLIDNIILENDPSDIKIAINEFAYHLTKRNLSKCLYWLAWILEWDKINTKRYGKYEINYRQVENVEPKFLKNTVWLIWDVINTLRKNLLYFGDHVREKENKEIDALWEMYKYNFTLGQRTRKNLYIIWAIRYLTTNINWDIQLIDRENLLFQSIANVDLLIKKMKSQEVNSFLSGHFNNKLPHNVVIENNYLAPEKGKEYIKESTEKKLLREKKEREKLARKKKITIASLDKLDRFKQMDRYLQM